MHTFVAASPRARTSPFRRKNIILVATLAVASLILSGCSTGDSTTPATSETAGARPVCTSPTSFETPIADLTPVADPHVGTGPCTAQLPERSMANLVEPGKQSLPTTVTSHDPNGDLDVTVTDTSRIVTFDIAGAIGETVFALGYGDSVVGRDATMTFDEAKDLPIVTGSSHSINAESVLALEPTLVITDGTVGPLAVVRQIADTGIPVVFVDRNPSISGAIEKASQIGAALGDAEAGKALSTMLSDEIDDTVEQIKAIAPKDPADRVRIAFLYLRGSSNIYYLFGEGSGADDLITALDGRDVASEIGWVGERPMTDEALIEANPDLLLVMTKGLDSVGGPEGLIDSLEAVALTNAGKNLNIIDMADSQIMTFGPRTPEALSALARAIYAPDAAAQQ
ncbi:heme/hemin ABC transporter substrate-binding protein [Lysinibacter cavernae]|uniref:Iron complex transport system substrate-binding protein n=1 Tax=Lysinibacter cavernae TaxID=1640652 RepID=A0A7X5R1B1_9MICO|nr:ABC transporter substrate-binding protein [Lysinibacter cavernae]NIH53776.1 iron complex transport system substrate-binding protein [Lysinibacter cavernae]